MTYLPDEGEKRLIGSRASGVADDRLAWKQRAQRLGFVELREQFLRTARGIEVSRMALTCAEPLHCHRSGALAVDFYDVAPGCAQPRDWSS